MAEVKTRELRARKAKTCGPPTEDVMSSKRARKSPFGAAKRSALGDITNQGKVEEDCNKPPILETKHDLKTSGRERKRAGDQSSDDNLQVAARVNVADSKDREQKNEEPRENILVEGSSSEKGEVEKAKEQCVEDEDEIDDVDAENINDPNLVSTYAVDIFRYLKEREEICTVSPYIHRQEEINASMRAILVDWMVEVQENFDLNHETLYLAVGLLDRYLQRVSHSRSKLQLYGCAAMLIASKFDERVAPSVTDFIFISNDAFDSEELLSAECSILFALSFDINLPCPYRFLRRFAKCGRCDFRTLTLARFVCELSLTDSSFVGEKPSCLAAGCLLLSRLMLHLKPKWSRTVQYYSGYSREVLTALLLRLNALVRGSRRKASAISQKYSHSVFLEVANIPLLDDSELDSCEA
uniref:G2/mitotic-specific cyclin-B3-like n=1 Tax=Myxine glutinosa TaxID=7769 RepID=UPI00359011E9